MEEVKGHNSSAKPIHLSFYQILIYFFILWLFFYSAVKYLVFRGVSPPAVGGIKDVTLTAMVLLGILGVVLNGLRVKRHYVWREMKWFVPILLVSFAYFFLDIFKGQSFYESLYSLRDYLFPFVLLLLGVMIGAGYNFNLKHFMRFFSLIFIMIFLYAIYQFFFFTIDTVLEHGLIEDDAKFFRFIKVGSQGEKLFGIRSFGVFSSPLEMAFASIFIFYNGVLGYKIDVKKYKAIHVICIILSFIVLYFTYTRTAIIALAASLYASSIFNKKIKIAMGIIGFPLLLYWIYRLTFISGGIDLSTTSHLMAFVKTYEYILQNPFGYGISFSGMRDGQIGVDGNFLYVLLNLGPLGLLAYLFAYINIFSSASLFQKSDTEQAMRSAIISFLICSLTMFIHPGAASWAFHLWIGILLGSLARQKRDCIKAAA